MDFFYTIKMRTLKFWGLGFVLAFFVAMFLWLGTNDTFTASSPSEETSALVKGNPDASDISLTFNISWGEERVFDILETLKEHDVQATFFVSGEWAERHPNILEQISEDEHDIGMLGYRYQSYLQQEPEEVREDLLQARETFGKLGLEDIELLRPPNGHFNEEIIQMAEELNYQVVHWNVNPNDWENPGTDDIVNTVMGETEGGDIILMHASDSVKQTTNALDIILPGLKEKGFEFATITKLMNQTETDSQLAE